jgi:RNA polymerase subunit RPABC4/transcription elongation factor Spt4
MLKHVKITNEIIVCPQCGSDDVYTTTTQYHAVNTNKVTCGRCNHHGTAQDWLDIAAIRAVNRARLAQPEIKIKQRSWITEALMRLWCAMFRIKVYRL